MNRNNVFSIIDGLDVGKDTFAISGRDLGIKQRKNFKLDEKDKDSNQYVFVVADNIRVISVSFFLGMFGDSVRAYKNKDEFLKKYVFKTNGLVDKYINDGIQQALSPSLMEVYK